MLAWDQLGYRGVRRSEPMGTAVFPGIKAMHLYTFLYTFQFCSSLECCS